MHAAKAGTSMRSLCLSGCSRPRRTTRCWPPGRTCSPPTPNVRPTATVRRARWITEHRVGERTQEEYLSLWRHHGEPYLGLVELAELPTETIRSWRAALLQDGRSEDRTVEAYRLVRAVLNTAVDDGRNKRNPCRIRVLGSIGRRATDCERPPGLCARRVCVRSVPNLGAGCGVHRPPVGRADRAATSI